METLTNRIKKIDNMINDIMGEHTVGMSVSIVKEDRVIFSKGFG